MSTKRPIQAIYKVGGGTYRVTVRPHSQVSEDDTAFIRPQESPWLLFQEQGLDALGEVTWTTVTMRNDLSKDLAAEILKLVAQQDRKPPIVILCSEDDGLTPGRHS